MTCQTIIVVERDVLIRETLIDLLTEEGYRTRAAVDALGAKQILDQESHPCLILVDLLSSGMNGSDFLAMRGDDDILLEIPVAIMSSVAMGPDEAARLRRQGAASYLKKPFDTDRLLEQVKQFCNAV